jgi:hypothetical protein
LVRHFETTRRLRVPIRRARQLLARDPLAILNPPGTTPGSVDHLGDGATEFDHQAAALREVDIEIVGEHSLEHPASWDLTWHRTAHGSELPNFRGRLSLIDGPLALIRLAGDYEPRLGMVGDLGDGHIGHRFSTQNLERYLDQVADRIETACRHDTVAPA